MMVFYALRALRHFWEFGMVHTFLLPAVFLVALLVQLLVINREKRPWLPLAVCGGVMVLCDVAAIIVVLILERGALLLAIIAMVVEMYLVTFIFGFSAALLIGRLAKKKQ